MKLSVIVVATLWDRFAKVAMPLTVVAVKVPCRVPVPALRATVITRPLSVVSRLPAESSTRMTGCCANVTPAVALEEGCVWIVSLLAAPAFTIIVGLVLAVLVPSVMSVAVTVWEPAVLSVTLTVRVPADKAPLAGNNALASLEVVATVWVLLTRFQFASTALIVTLKAVFAVRAVGKPVLPVAVPGAAVSPGTNTCSFTNGPALTVTDGLVLALLLTSVRSLAVTVLLPAVLKVTLKLCVPATKAALAGWASFRSLVLMPTVSVTVLIVFQLASTALSVTLNGVPAV